MYERGSVRAELSRRLCIGPATLRLGGRGRQTIGNVHVVHDTAAARTRAELSRRLCLGPATLDTAAARTRAELNHRLCLGPATLRLRAGGGDIMFESYMLYMTLLPRVPERR